MFRKLFARIVLFLPLALLPACNDSGTGPGTGAVHFGTLAGGTQKLVDTYVTANAPILGSLAYFLSDIQDVLAAAAPSGRTSAAPAQTCIASSLAGKVFDHDGSVFVDTGGTGPADGVRFLLHAVSGTNPPIEPIGYVDIVCGSTLPDVDLTVSLVWNGTTVVELGMTGLYNTYPTLTLDGFYAAPQGSPQLHTLSGQLSGGLSMAVGFTFPVLPELTALYRVVRGPLGDTQVVFYAAMPEGNLDVNLRASTAGPAAQGTAVFKGELVACLVGSLSNPTASDPADAGCSLPDTPAGSVSRADREAMVDAYTDARVLYGYLRFLADLGLAAVPG
jgi:hypothetical protein